MSQDTVVMSLSPAEGAALERQLRAGDYAFRTVPYARFSARADGLNVTFYDSGKLVIQGRQASWFADVHLGGAPAVAKPAPADQDAGGIEVSLQSGPLVGGDESGKGDYFGPLVVAAVRIGPGDAARLREGGVMDSKKVTDERALRLGNALQGQFPTAIRSLDPPAYLAAWQAHDRNVALLLSDLYAEVVAEIAQPGDQVLIDQFSKFKGRLESAFRSLDVTLHQEHRAERNPAVAAASLVARQEFLEGLARLGEEHGLRLPKGAGTPVLDLCKRLVRERGAGALPLFEQVTKLHFRTTDRFFPGLREERGIRSPSEENSSGAGRWRRRR